MNINIRLLRENEVSVVNEVYNTEYGNIRPDSFFEWEFLQGPSGKAIYVVAEDLDKIGNKIIGTQSAIPLYFISSEGKRVLTAKSEDTFVHPEYRGHKLFDKMYDVLFEECRKQKIEYIWGFTYAKKPFLKLGFSIPFDTLQGLAVFKWLPAYRYFASLNERNSFLDKVKILGMTFLANCKWKFISLCSSLKGIEVKKEKPTQMCRGKLFQEMLQGNAGLWSLDQDQTYLNWRIDSNPYRNSYEQILVSSDSGRKTIGGLLNYRTENFAYLEDLLFGKLAEKKQILGLVKACVFEKSIHSMRFWGFDSNPQNKKEIELLEKSGFIFVKKGTSFVWKSLSPVEPGIHPENILLSRLFTQGNR